MQKMANWLVSLLSIYSSCFLEAYDKKLQFLKPWLPALILFSFNFCCQETSVVDLISAGNSCNFFLCIYIFQSLSTWYLNIVQSLFLCDVENYQKTIHLKSRYFTFDFQEIKLLSFTFRLPKKKRKKLLRFVVIITNRLLEGKIYINI